MLLHLNNLLGPDELQAIQTALGDHAPWRDGSSSAGGQALAHKNNQQLAQDSELARALQSQVLAAVQRDPLFVSAALPRKVFNPLFNRYGGQSNHYGDHIDGAVLRSHANGQWVRSDIACTLFLADPASYDGGELVVLDSLGERRLKLPAGDAVIYPASTVHRVEPVTRGVRLASFFWIESMVRCAEQRRLLFDMDMNLLRLRARHGESAETTALTGTYHNLLRQWAHT